jgi:hypothetical protein
MLCMIQKRVLFSFLEFPLGGSYSTFISHSELRIMHHHSLPQHLEYDKFHLGRLSDGWPVQSYPVCAERRHSTSVFISPHHFVLQSHPFTLTLTQTKHKNDAT